MKGYKKILSLILFALVSLSGAFFGCRGRYDGVKITSDKSETGLQLYLDEEIDDGNSLSVGTISFTISGATEGAVNKLKYSFEGNEESKIVKITNTQIEGNTATLTLQAISGGSTTLVALSEEGGKTCGVKIECIKQVKAMNFNSKYSPAMFNVAGSKLVINTKKIDFVPADTTQNKVVYSLKNAVDGISINQAGIITLEKQVTVNDFVVVATNVNNLSLTSEISVHLVKPLTSEDGDGINIFCESDLYEDDKINLTTVGEESSVIIRADVDTTENITLGYKIDRNSGSIDCVNVEQNGFEFGVYANNIGVCKLIIQVYFDDYPELEVVEKEIEVTVVELPTTISVNGDTADFADDIYTYYQNGLGQEYLIKIGESFAYDKSFILASDKVDGFEIRKSDGSQIKFGVVDDAGVVGGEYDVLQSNSSIFVKGISPNVDATLYIYANGTLGKRMQLVRKIFLKTLLGSENVEPEYRTLDGEETKVFYVEQGKSFELKYSIDENTSAKNIRLLNADGSEIFDYISFNITNSSMPTITVTGVKPGSLSCKLMLENLVESETFIIYVFVPVNYLDSENLDGGVYFNVDSPLTNRNIAEAVYTQYGNYSSLNKMVISLGAAVQLHLNNDPVNATIFEIKYSGVLLNDGAVVENSDASEYIAVYSSGYVVAKKVLPDTIIVDGREVSQQSAIKIQISSLTTNEDGNVEIITSTKYIEVEGYVPLRDVTISKKNSTIYWNYGNLLNPFQQANGAYMDTVSLALYPNSISGAKVKIDWDYPSELTLRLSQDKATATVMAIAQTNDVRDASIYTITATVQYYTTTIVRRFTVNVLKAIKAKTLTAYVQDDISQNNTIAYFEAQGANGYYPESKQIVAKVYSDQFIQNVTFDKIYYYSANSSVAVVSEDGVITPVGPGSTDIRVYSQDMLSSADTQDFYAYKVIKVVVADGLSKESAFKISTESDFDRLANNPDYFYYLANDITFTSSHFVPEFNGNFDGNNHYINGIILNEFEKQNYQDDSITGKYISLFGNIGSDATIENLNLTFSLNYDTQDYDIYLAGLAKTNNGTIRNVEIYYLNANINLLTEKDIYFAGAVIENNGFLIDISASVNINIDATQNYVLNNLNVAGFAIYNNNYIYGKNDNYKPVLINAIQEYDFAGKIIVSDKISATESAIGGIVAKNKKYGVIGSTGLENGLAVDIVINAQNIDNVGGLVGDNLGQINNALANVDIVARNNVGGAVGRQYIEPSDNPNGDSEYQNRITESKKLQLSNVVVEMYDNIDGINFGKVEGNENVGGLVGNLFGYFEINANEIKDDLGNTVLSESYNDFLVHYSQISYSYVYAYSAQSGIFGQDKVGGLVGNARLTTIDRCYANTKITIENNAQDDRFVGGLVGVAQNLKVEKAYSIINYEDAEHVVFGSVAGKISKYNFIYASGYTEKSYIDEFYSTCQTDFVGNGTLNLDYEFGANGAYKENLTDINTFADWKIGERFTIYDEINQTYIQNDWVISASENNGYPSLVFSNSNLMRKVQPTQLFITSQQVENSIIINDKLIVLDIEKTYKLSDVIKVSTDVSTRATIYAYSDKQGVLNTRNTTNKLSANTSLQSNTEQIVTLTFVLGNNISVTKSIQIAFVNLAKIYKVNDLRIKKGDSQNISANISFDSVENLISLNLANYKLGILKSDITYLDENSEEKYYVQISNAEIKTIDEKEYVLFSSGSAVLAKENVRKSDIQVLLLYKLDYIDLNNESKTEYIQVIKDSQDPQAPKQVETIDINVYSGATSIYASTTNIDMTIIDEVSFTITVKTDDVDTKLYVDPASENIYCNSNLLGGYVKLSNNATYQQSQDNAKVEIYVLNTKDEIIEKGTLEVTFALRFLDKYFANEKFNKEFASKMQFWSEKGFGQDGESDVVLTEINLKAMPQWLLKIDINNYPAGKTVGNSYVPVSVPANTLTPGQKGLMVIDIYPEYAYYDQIEVVSSEDADGNYISFIQVAQNADYNQNTNSDVNEYVELKPNTNIIEKGLVLMPYSTITFNGSGYTTAFDGRFYVNTLMGSNVKAEEEITITVTGLTYQIDEDGNYVLDENGNYIISRQLIKTLVVVVNPAPEVALSVNDEIYTSPVYVKNESDYKFAGEYNLILADSSYLMQIELKNGLVATRSEVAYAIYKEISFNEAGEIINGSALDVDGINVGTIENLSFSIGFTNELETGNIVEVWVNTYKTINGFTETYTSNKQRFLVVDKILTGLNINESTTNLSFVVNEPRNLHAQLEYTTQTAQNNDDIDNKDINDNGAYWSGYNSRDREYIGWGELTQAENEIIENRRKAEEEGKTYDYNTPTKNFENFIAYKTVDEGDKQGTFGITATNNSISVSKFKVELYYYYVQETVDGSTTCTLQITPDINESSGIKKDHTKNVVREINMDISVKTTIDEPLTVYTIDDFYSMVSGRDYILMNDLYFGNVPQEIIDTIDDDKWARTYTPFEFDANSFDGNMHKIHFYGDYFNITTDGAGKEIVYVNNKEETVANIGLFTTINAEKIVKDLDIEYHTISENSSYAINIDKDTTMPASTINFGGLATTNNGIVSNVFVYFDGDISINTKSAEGQVNIAGFVYQNSGKITYSSVYGPNWNDNNFKDDIYSYHNVKFQSYRAGNIATFVCTNSYLISNCETEWLGIESLAPASRNAQIAGFVVNNSGRIYNSSSAGQVLEYSPNTSENRYVVDAEDFYANEINFATAIKDNDERLSTLFNDRKQKVEAAYSNGEITETERNEKIEFFEQEQSKYFAKLSSNANIAGFVYRNSGEIENAYASYPMQTGARTAGFVFDNSNAGSVITSYTVCYYDGTNTNNSAYAPFVGTNDLGEVLNNSQTSVVKYSYYILEEHEVYEEDETFKEPASRISLSAEDDNSFSNSNSFVGFDKGKLTSIWNVFETSHYLLPVLNTNLENKLMRDGFVRNYIQFEKDGVTQIKFTRVSDERNPYQIADATQFVNVFNQEATWFKNDSGEKVSGYLNHSIRLINDIDLTDFAGTEELNNIRKVVYMGDFDGNGMIISGINLVGSEEFGQENNSVQSNIFSNVSSSYGLFNQIGTATVATTDLNVYKYSFTTKQDDRTVNKTRIRNLTLKVNNVSKSTSAFTGILAGVIINTDIQSVKIQSNNVSVLGKNVVGGLAGGIFGDSKIYSVSVNANATSSYQSISNNLYQGATEENGRFKVGGVELEYEFIDYSAESTNYGFGKNDDGTPKRIDLAEKVKTCSYAGGVAGLVDVYDEEALLVNETPYQKGLENKSGNILNRTPNLELLTVYGDITISAEIVGGVVGATSEDAYLGNIVFEVSTSNNQKLAGLFASGGIVGINNGGIIQLSKAELNQAYSASNDNQLTNQTGNYLFNSSNVYPFAVGGLVGVERGGYMLSDYSKTNVICPNAKYVGGLVGYLTDYKSVFKTEVEVDDITDSIPVGDKKLGRYVLMEEVYTTGNVFAGDGYTSELKIKEQDDGNGNIVEKQYYLYTPTSYAGGIVGYYKPIEIDGLSNLDRFNSVMGINAFHIPANYTVSSNYVLDLGGNKTGSVKYSDLMNGYNGKRTLSNGTIEYAEFLPRLGSIFGKVEASTDIFKYENGRTTQLYYYNLYTNYVYNSTTITESMCTNAKDSTGANLEYIASGINGTADNTADLINKIKSPLFEVDKFSYSTGSAEEGRIYVYLNATTDGLSGNEDNIKPSRAYLVLRALTTYRKYQANDSGIYSGWDNNWIFKSPVYPTFKPKDWNRFIDISTEQDLRQIRSGNKYRIIKDIYLTYEWNAKSLNHITLTSAKRNDSEGIDNSIYYAIYNINMRVDSGNQNSYGFFGELRYSTVKNINFVYGTNIDNPYTGDKYGDHRYTDAENNKIVETKYGKFGFRYNGNANNVGLFAGLISRGTNVEGCSLYLNTDSGRLYDNTEDNFTSDCTPTIEYKVELDLKENSVSFDKYVGGMIGYVKDGSSASGNITFGSLTRTISQGFPFTTMAETDISTADYNFVVINKATKNEIKNEYINEFSVGGFIGKLDSAKLESDFVKSLALKFTNQGYAEKVNIGGALGIFESSDDNISSRYEIGSTATVKILVEGEQAEGKPAPVFKELSVGGLYGYISSSINSENGNSSVNCKEIKLVNVSAEENSTRSIDTEGLYVGGVAGRVNSSKISGGISTIKINTIDVGNANFTNRYVGGLVGYVEGKSDIKSLSTSTDATTNIKLGKIVGRNYIGGAFGYVSSSAKIDNCSAYFEKIDIPNSQQSITTSDVLNVGGFVGAMTHNSSEINSVAIDNSYAKGTIDFSNSDSISSLEMNISGFVANGASTNSTQQQNKTKISNSVSDVEIKLSKVFDNSRVAGFSASGINYFANCISLGDIIISEVINKNNVLVAGFASYEIPNDKNLGTNYSLSTIKAVANSYSKIVATDKNYNSKILYNYNLSGVFSDQAKKTGTTASPIGERTYLELCGSVQNVMKTIKNNNTLLKSKVGSYFSEAENTRLGTKVQPKEIADAVIFGYVVNFINNDYYYVDDNYALGAGTLTINANLINNSKDTAYMLTLKPNTTIGENIMLSGVAINTNASSFVGSNIGYIFNCVAVGKITSTGGDIVGFVETNNGIINACGTNVYLDSANNQVNSVGFVGVNSGIIANSYATNVFLNTVASTASEPSFFNVDFVSTNNGIILNSYSSPSIFDLIDENGNLLDETATNTICSLNGNSSYCIYKSNYYDARLCSLASFGQVSLGNISSSSPYDFTIHYTSGFLNESLNYGLATPLSYNVVNREEFTLGSLNTGDGTIDKPYKVNTFQRFEYLGEKELQSKSIRLVNNINSPSSAYSGFKAKSSLNIKNLDNLEVYSIYNLNLASGTSLFTINKINSNSTTEQTTLSLNNFGVVGKYQNNDIKTSGSFVVDSVSNLTATNSYVSIKDELKISGAVEYYGLFAGNVTNSLTMQGCFANADITINQCTASTVSVGTLVGKSNGGSISNSFATGTTTINNQNLKNKLLYVGGLVGDSGSIAFSYCYSNVSLKNKVSDKNYKNAYVGAFGGTIKTWSEYGFTHYANFFDENISLTDKIFGNKDSSKSLSSYITLLTSPVFQGTNYVNTVTENHLPIQKAFTGNKIVYSTLNISDSSQTGSKMGPKMLRVNDLLGDFESNVYYYLNSSLRVNYSNNVYRNITIIGNDKKIDNSKRNEYKFLFNCNGYAENLTISGVVIDTAFASDIRNSYIYNLNIIGESGTPIYISSANSYHGCAPISYSNNTIFDSCSVSGDIMPKEKIGSQEYASYISSFIHMSNNNIIKDIDINVTIGVYENLIYTHTSGIVSRLTGDGETTILGDIKVNLKTNVHSDGSIGYTVGGIIGSMSNADMLKIYANIDTKLDVKVEMKGIYIGGLIGKIDRDYYFINGIIHYNDTIGFDFAANIINAKIDITSSVDSYNYISPAVGYCNISSLKTLTGINVNCSPEIKITSNNSIDTKFNIGGIVGYLQSGILDSVICNGNKFVVDKYGSSQAYIRIGGVVGITTNNATISNCTVNQDINVTDNSSISFCVVGGVVGEFEGGKIKNSTCNGLVAGLTYATEAVNQLTVEDARKFEEKIAEWTSTVTNASGYSLTMEHTASYLSNYGTSVVSIPLVVGGIIGYYESGVLTDVTKTTGDVRALIYANSAVLEDDSSINMVQGNDAGGNASSLSTQNQAENGEKCQARVGAICGLATITVANVKFEKVGSTKHIYSNMGATGMSDKNGRIIRLVGKDGTNYGKFLRYGVSTRPNYGASAGYYTFEGFDTSNIYYDFGKINPNGTNLASSVDGNNDGTAYFKNFNYIQWESTKDNRLSYTELSQSSFNSNTIFAKSSSDYYLQYNGNYNNGQYYNTSLSNSDYVSNTGNYMCYIDYNNTGAADLNGMHLHANNKTDIAQNNESSKVKVFAGYRYYYIDDMTNRATYKTLNRSFWYIASDILSGNGEDHFGTDEANMYKTSLYFYPTQHWAGTVVGGVVH